MHGAFKSIPTRYSNTNFRSRLEARWAAFFDIAGWRWEYEPFDLNGWIPDFVLLGKCQHVLVEVKPVHGPDDPLFVKTVEEINRALPELKKTADGCPIPQENNETLVLSYFLPDAKNWDAKAVGWFARDEFGGQGAALIGSWTSDEIGFCHELNSFHDRISGGYDGGHVSTDWAGETAAAAWLEIRPNGSRNEHREAGEAPASISAR
jgi:hypothetical protein